MKTKFLRVLLAMCCVLMLATTFAATVSAHTFSKNNLYIVFNEPELTDYVWAPLETVTATRQTPRYFIIETTSGGFKEELYISFPAEGGFRLQSKHEYQMTVEVSNEGLLEPSSIAVIDYATDNSGALIMKGSDGTVVRYQKDGNGFLIEVLNSKQTRIIYLTNEQISFGHKKDGTVVRTMVEMPMQPDKESIYNGSNRYCTPNVIGNHFSLTNKDCFSDVDYAYGNVPLFHSNRGYSLWFNMTYPGEANFENLDLEKYTITFDGDKLDFFLWTGTPLENVKKYTDITGTSGVTEEWTFGFWGGAGSAPLRTTYLENNVANMQMILEGYKEHYNFYPEAFYGEGIDSAEAFAYCKRRGIKMMGWMRPACSTTDIADFFPSFTSPTPVRDAAGNFISTGYPYVYSDLTFKETGNYVFSQPEWLDTSNPSFIEYVTNLWSKAWSWGLAGCMIDMGENQTYKGMNFNGLSALEMHNFSSYYYAMNSNKAWTAALGNDYVLYMRSGCAGSQYWSPNFQGDQVSTYEGFSAALYDMISRGAGGFNLYGSDMGGYRSHPTKDLWNRWVTLSTFSPYMRTHGNVIHMPWEYGYAADANFGEYYYLRKNLVPTIMSAAIDANKTANPMVKGMMVAYPYYLSLRDVNNQYLFCDDFLVCAVTDADRHSLVVNLPTGNAWYSLFSYDKYKGGQKITVEAPSNFMPIFVKDGAVKAINLPDSMTLMDEMHDEEDTAYSEHASLLITPPSAARTSTIYTKGESKDFRTYASTSETYTNAPVDDTTFTVTNTEGSARRIVLALGVTAAKVTYDGNTLKRLEAVPDYYNDEYGYYVDLSGMTTVFMPEGWKELRIVKGDADYKPYELSSENVGGAQRMFDDDPESYCRFPVGDGQALFTIEADKAQPIGRIEVKWTAGFLQSYDIEYSSDNGATWEVLLPEGEEEHTVSAGGGGVDIIKCDGIQATDFSIVSVKRGDTDEMPGIYELKVYPTDDYKLIEVDDGDDDDDDDDDDYYDEDSYTPEDWGKDDDGKKSDGSDNTDTPGKKRRKLIISYFPTWLIILLVGVGVVVVTGAVVLILLLRKKKKKAALASADAQPEAPPQDGSVS